MPRGGATFQLSRDRVEGRDCFSFDGVIDEFARLDKIDLGQGSLTIDLGGVRRINSFGSRDFRRLMRSLEGRNLILRRCSIPLVEQANLIAGFFHHAVVESFYVPMICHECAELTPTLVTSASYQEEGLPKRHCAECSELLELDDDEGYYFGFLQHAKG